MIKRLQVQVPAGMAGRFSSPGSTFCADSYCSSHSTPLTPQWHIKDPSHYSKSAGGRLHLQLSTHAPYVCGFEGSDTVTWCMGYMVFTELVLRQGQFHVAPVMSQPNTSNSAVSPPLWWLFKNMLQKAAVTHAESHAT